MALQTSGTIYLSQIQGQYGGANPIWMSEYYRKTDNSGYVKHSKLVTENPTYVYSTTSWAWASPAYLTIRLLGAYVYSTSSAGGSGVTVVVAGGWTYYRGTYVGEASASYYYRYSRTQTQYLNQNVPTSGTIWMTNFYGGTN